VHPAAGPVLTPHPATIHAREATMKLTLKIEDLAVETFTADPDAGSDATQTVLDLCTKMTGLCPCTPAV
jgi:hypothetical protein